MANRNVGTLAEMVSNDFTWEIIGVKTITGKDEFLKAVEVAKSDEIAHFTLETAIGHGKNASANGT
ncbi:hypothetical protein [Dyadobacter sp. CY312]|uniref:hypothetical protein n=1 Tax=Dyadobacter sp. CY312 TaxID=2907303 RepID=UPI001F275D69|nr:hypothetical protein [Dyadobacter sp. CY312]MCE7040360.1 hypothetical protein [Dyadobacter sp. CY312]